MYTHLRQTVKAGIPLKQAGKAIVMLHGRGSTAENIIALTRKLHLDNTAIFAPRATKHSWYPYSFLAPVAENQPALNSALEVIDELVTDIVNHGIPTERIYFAGFSQGACLTLEYTARNARKFGGIIAFTGGLIGDKLDRKVYSGNFDHTPILITTGDPDPHVPVDRVEESARILKELNADVTVKVYPGRPHTIQFEEFVLANQLIFNKQTQDL